MKRLLCILLLLNINSNLNSQNNCLHFDGEDDFVQFSGFFLQNDFTISFWFKPSENSNGGNDDRIISSGPETRLELGVADFDCDSGYAWLYDQNAGLPFCEETDFRDGDWHHMAFKIFGPTRTLYIDGINVLEYPSLPIEIYGSSFRFGQWTGGSTALTYYEGYLDEVRIWNYALEADSIVANMNCELKGSEEGLIAYWNFNQGNAGQDNTEIEELLDLTVNEIHGELHNFLLIDSTSNFVESGAPLEGTCGLSSSFDLLKESIVISPNPTSGKFHIESTTPLVTQLEIVRADGTLILTQDFSASRELDISGQSAGIYFVKVLVGERWLTYKVVKF